MKNKKINILSVLLLFILITPIFKCNVSIGQSLDDNGKYAIFTYEVRKTTLIIQYSNGKIENYGLDKKIKFNPSYVMDSITVKVILQVFDYLDKKGYEYEGSYPSGSSNFEFHYVFKRKE